MATEPEATAGNIFVREEQKELLPTFYYSKPSSCEPPIPRKLFCGAFPLILYVHACWVVNASLRVEVVPLVLKEAWLDLFGVGGDLELYYVRKFLANL